MKKILLLITVLLGACTLINAQSVERQTLKYTPSGVDVFIGVGYEVSIPFAWKFIDCYGPRVGITKKSNKATSSVYIYKGKRYTAMEVVGQQYFPKPFIGKTNLTADVYDDAYRLGTVKLENVTAIGGGCLGEAYSVIEMLGLDEKKYKDKLASLSLKNVRITYCHTNDTPIESKIDKLLLGKEFDNIIQEADNAFNRRNYDKAKELYKKANRGNFYEFDQSHAKAQLEKIKEIEKQQAEKKAEAERKEKEIAEAEEEARRREASGLVNENNSNSEISNNSSSSNNGDNSGANSSSNSNTSSNNNTSSNASTSTTASSSNTSNNTTTSSNNSVPAPSTDYSDVATIAVVAAIALATLYASYEIGKIIYTDLDDYKVNERGGNSSRLTKKLGFTVTSAPMRNYQTSTLDLAGGVDYWPLYGDNFGFGGSSTLSAGVGVLYQNAQISGDLGLMTYYGSENLRGVFEYHRGYRRFSVFQWLFDDLSGAQDEYYHRFMAGVSFNAESSFYGYTQMYIDLLAIYENFNNPVAIGGRNNFQPLGENANYGLRLNLRYEDRINFYAETVLRNGVDTYFKIGAIRTFEKFGRPGDYNKASRLTATSGKNVIYPLITSFHWANEKSTLDSTLATSSHVPFNFGVGFEKDFNINTNWSVQGGVGLSVLHSTRYNNYRYQHSSLNLSVGLRYSEYLYKKDDKYWVLAGINNRINIQKNITEGSERILVESLETNRFVPQWMFGAGLDYTVGSLGMRSGIQYERSMGSLYQDDYKSLTSNTISFNWGFMF
jgi:hypothetical protein